MSELIPEAGRPATLPVEYDSALRSLMQCTRIDDARYWADKADALAAWSKIYRSDRAGELAKQLKLHAYRRMAQLAAEIRPHVSGSNGRKCPGGKSLLLEHGLTKGQAAAAVRLASISEGQFKECLEKPAAPTTVAHRLWNTSPAWKKFSRATSLLRSLLESADAAETADAIAKCGDRELVAALEVCQVIERGVHELLGRLREIAEQGKAA